MKYGLNSQIQLIRFECPENTINSYSHLPSWIVAGDGGG